MSFDATADTGVVDPATLRNLLEATGGDPEFVAELVEEFASDGQEQLSAMREAAVSGDAATLTRAVHTLKSTAASFGAVGLAERCRVLEADVRAGRLDGVEREIIAVSEDLEAVLSVLSRWRPDGV